jgi:hypothetical protein
MANCTGNGVGVCVDVSNVLNNNTVTVNILNNSRIPVQVCANVLSVAGPITCNNA